MLLGGESSEMTGIAAGRADQRSDFLAVALTVSGRSVSASNVENQALNASYRARHRRRAATELWEIVRSYDCCGL